MSDRPPYDDEDVSRRPRHVAPRPPRDAIVEDGDLDDDGYDEDPYDDALYVDYDDDYVDVPDVAYPIHGFLAARQLLDLIATVEHPPHAESHQRLGLDYQAAGNFTQGDTSEFGSGESATRTTEGRS